MKIKYQPWRQARLQAALDHQLWGASKLRTFARWFFECRVKLFPRIGKPIATRFHLRILGLEVRGSEHWLCKLFKRKQGQTHYVVIGEYGVDGPRAAVKVTPHG